MQRQPNETGRKLQQKAFVPSSFITNDLPKDTVLKGLQIRLSGAIQTTFASGTPASNAESIIDNLVNRIDVVINGGDTVKSVKPHMLRMQQLFTTQVLGERRASAAAAAVAQPTTDQGFVYGTTTQYTTVAETLLLSFEMVYAEPTMGRETTYLNLKGASSAEIRLNTNAYSGLLASGNSAPVTYGNSTLVFDFYTMEAAEIPKEVRFAIWKQTFFEEQFSSETRERGIEITGNNRLTGIMIFAQDGGTGLVASDLAITDMSLRANGQLDLMSSSFKQKQAENRSRYGINAPFTSSASLISGVAHINLLSRKDLSTALDMRELDSVFLYLSTNTSSVVSYTTPVKATIMVEEIVIR